MSFCSVQYIAWSRAARVIARYQAYHVTYELKTSSINLQPWEVPKGYQNTKMSFSSLLKSGLLKVSKSRKQIILSSHIPKNQRKFSHFFALASKSGQIKNIKVFYCVEQHQISIFMLLSFVSTTFYGFLEARAKKCEHFHWFCGV